VLRLFLCILWLHFLLRVIHSEGNECECNGRIANDVELSFVFLVFFTMSGLA
jgi:hypothetical protein